MVHAVVHLSSCPTVGADSSNARTQKTKIKVPKKDKKTVRDIIHWNTVGDLAVIQQVNGYSNESDNLKPPQSVII